jgi:O-acetyl-ADP-ribose deacetylase (regulator of RNase III)
MSQQLWEYNPSPGKWIRLLQGDITDETVDAIVNAANSHLQHGGGVAGAIVRKGGFIIQEESNKIGYVPVGNCAITIAGKLRAKFVIHAVGPMWGEGDEEKKLYNAMMNSLLLADKKKFQSISFPAISSGIFGFPKDRCAQILLQASLDFYQNHPETTISDIRFCIIDKLTVDLFHSEFQRKISK